MAHAQKPDFLFRWNGRVHLNRRGRQFSPLLAAEVCASAAVVMLDTPCSEVVWRVLATHSIRQFPLHFPSRASACAITFQLESTTYSECVYNFSYPACSAHAPYCHLCPVMQYNIFPHYLKNRTLFREKVLNIKCVFEFCLRILSERFLILRRIGRDIITNVHRYLCKGREVQ